MKKALNSRSLVVLVVVLLIAAFFIFDLGQYLTLDYLKSNLFSIFMHKIVSPRWRSILPFTLPLRRYRYQEQR